MRIKNEKLKMKNEQRCHFVSVSLIRESLRNLEKPYKITFNKTFL